MNSTNSLEEIAKKRLKSIQEDNNKRKTFKLPISATIKEYSPLKQKTKLLKDNGFNRSEYLRQVLLELDEDKINLMLAYGIIKKKKKN